MKKKSCTQTHSLPGKELQEICKPVYSEIIAEYLNLDDHYNIITDISSYNTDEVVQEVIVVRYKGEGYIIIKVNGTKNILKI